MTPPIIFGKAIDKIMRSENVITFSKDATAPRTINPRKRIR